MIGIINNTKTKTNYQYFDKGYNITLEVDKRTAFTKAKVDLSCDGADVINLQFDCLNHALDYFKNNL